MIVIQIIKCYDVLIELELKIKVSDHSMASKEQHQNGRYEKVTLYNEGS